jgi:hypothetical protein
MEISKEIVYVHYHPTTETEENCEYPVIMCGNPTYIETWLLSHIERCKINLYYGDIDSRSEETAGTQDTSWLPEGGGGGHKSVTFGKADVSLSFSISTRCIEHWMIQKAILVTCLGGLYVCEMLRMPHCIDNRQAEGGKVVSPTHRQHFTLQKHCFFFVSGTHFSQRLSVPQGLVLPERLLQLKKKIASSGLELATFRLAAYSYK